MTTTTFSVTKMSLKFSTNCESCGRMFRFESNNLADLDASRWPTKCEDCRVPGLTKTTSKPTAKSYLVAFLVNDDRGMSTGKVTSISIDDEVTLEGPPKVLRVEGTLVKVGRRWYPCHRWMPHVGNIYWDAATMTIESATRLVRDLLDAGWTATEWASDGWAATMLREVST